MQGIYSRCVGSSKEEEKIIFEFIMIINFECSDEYNNFDIAYQRLFSLHWLLSND